MKREEISEMDRELKDAIYSFLYNNISQSYDGHIKEITDDLEEYLRDKGFDLGCIIQYKITE